jgi:AAA family ATP:ADP antiporter
VNKKKNHFYNIISRLADIKSGEETIAVLLFAFFFLITAPHTIIKALRYTDLLDKVGSQGLPLAYLLAAIVTGFVVVLQSKIQFRISNQKLIISALIFFVLTGLLFQVFLEKGGGVLAYLYWIWASVFIVVFMTHFGLTVTEVFNPRQARRLIGFCGSGGILGGVLGGFGSYLLTRYHYGQFLLPLACGLLFVCAFVVNAIFKFQIKQQSSTSDGQIMPPEPQKVGLKDSFNFIRKNRHLLLIAGLVLVTGIIATLIDFQFSSKVEHYFDTPVWRKEELQAFFGLFFGGLTTFAFFLQLLLTSRFLKRFGLLFTLLLAPVVLLLGLVGIVIAGLTLPLVIIVKGSDESLAFSLNQSLREILYIPMTLNLRYKTRPFIDMFLNRLARVIAAILLFIAGVVLAVKEVPYISPVKDPRLAEQLTWVIIFFIGLWIILNFKISKEYVSVVKQNIPLKWRRVDKAVAEKIDIDYTKMVFDAVESKNRSSILYAMHLFDLLEQDKLTPAIRKIISHKMDEVKVSSLSELFDAKETTWFPDIDDDVELEGLITDIREIMSLDSYQQLMKIYSEKVMEESTKTEIDRMELAKAIGMMDPNDALVENLEALINDRSPEVSRYAIASAAKLRKKENIPAIINKLSNPLTREDATSALKIFGLAAMSTLKEYLVDSRRDVDLRKAVVALLARMGTQLAADVLFGELRGKSDELDTEIIDALDRIRAEKADIRIQERVAKRKAFDVIKKYCQIFIDLQEVKPGKEDEKVRNDLQKNLDELFMNIFKLLGLYYPQEDIIKAFQNLKTGTKDSIAYAIELLDITLKKDMKDIILPLIEDLRPSDRLRKFQKILKYLHSV